MVITSIPFVLLAIASVIIFYLINIKFRIVYLALLSCMFIGSFSLNLLFYLILYSVFNYYLGLRLLSASNKKALFRSGILLNLIQLIFLRYSSFAIDPFLNILGSDILASRLSEIIVPVGISYFTLQGMGYLINVKMGWEKPERKFLHFFLYITFYPKFLSGPIERSNHFLPQLNKGQVFNEQDVSEGLRIALFGFFKKIAIANRLAPYFLDAYSDMGSMNGDTLWVLLLLGPIYLYFDFSGYTDIAIGIARTFGIQLLPNFNRPFFSENMTTFWKRFHISLSSWFNDYVFRQTSFKYRKWGVYASVFALLVTWTLFGIWHGAGWNFMMLGLIQAIAIIYEFFTKKWRLNVFSRLPLLLRTWTGRIFTYLFYSFSLVFFYSPDISTAFNFFSHLPDTGHPLMFGPLSRAPYSLFIYIPVILLLELLNNDFEEAYKKLQGFWTSQRTRRMILRWTLYSLMIILIMIVGNRGEQFIYVNF